MKNLRVCDIPYPIPSFWLSLFQNGRYNRKGMNYFRLILEKRTEDEALCEWENVKIPEEDWKTLNEIILSCGIFQQGFIFPHDEIAVFCGHWLKRSCDDLETEEFLWESEKHFQRQFPQNVDWWKPEMTFLEFYQFLQTLPQGPPPPNKPRWGCCAILLILLFVPPILAAWYSFRTEGIWSGILAFLLIFSIGIGFVTLFGCAWMEMERLFKHLFRRKK